MSKPAAANTRDTVKKLDLQTGTFDFSFGRLASTEVANFWAKHFPSINRFDDGVPLVLNAAFVGRLELTVETESGEPHTAVFEDIGFACDRSKMGGTDYWTFGGKSCGNIHPRAVLCHSVNDWEKQVAWRFQEGFGPGGFRIDIVDYHEES